MNLHGVRSLLFLPADRRDRLEKAVAVRTGGLILDLEDGVAPNAKPDARRGLPEALSYLKSRGSATVLRINDGDATEADLAAIKQDWPDAIMLPKAASAGAIEEFLARLARRGVASEVALIALIETPAGVLNAATIAGVCRPGDALAFGGEDYATAMGVNAAPAELSFAAHMVALAARAQFLPAFGIIGSIAEFRDEAAFRGYCVAAQKAGYTGALTIHPAQSATAEAAFAPSAEEVAWAKAVVEDFLGADSGAIRGRDGKMIDRPVLERARRTIERATLRDMKGSA